MARQTILMDGMAIALSSLCLIHCLFFPAIIVALPLLASSLVATETIHKLLVFMALPISFAAFVPAWRLHRRPIIALLAIFGILSLIAGAFAISLKTVETELTVAGGTMLVIAHILNWRQRCRKGFAPLT
jgi:MerC mercury resistance protein